MATDPQILLVDDDREVCRSMEDVLTDFGYRVCTAPDGFTALQLLQDYTFQLALLDYSMPEMSGLDLYRQIRQIRPTLLSAFVTAYADTELMNEVQAEGVKHIFGKPIDFDKLLVLLEEAVGKPA